MLGKFQQSHLRIEIDASATAIQESLLQPSQFRQWLWFQRFSPGLPERLYVGLTFTSWAGPVAIEHQVVALNEHHLRFLLSQGVDGYHEWDWGDGWVQSRLEGISLLPLNLAQTLGLLRLRQFLTGRQQPQFG